jgi:hypothetical protein
MKGAALRASGSRQYDRKHAHRTRKLRRLDEARLRQQAIGVRLRQMFDEVVNEDVPEEFLEILRRADERGSEKA